MPQRINGLGLLLANLRESIEVEHERALRALVTLESYLKEGSGDCGSAAKVNDQILGPLLPLLHKNRSKRQRVLEAICDGWQTVKEISHETQLPESNVRGVLYANGPHKCLIERDQNRELIRFRIRPECVGEVRGE